MASGRCSASVMSQQHAGEPARAGIGEAASLAVAAVLATVTARVAAMAAVAAAIATVTAIVTARVAAVAAVAAAMERRLPGHVALNPVRGMHQFATACPRVAQPDHARVTRLELAQIGATRG